MFRSLLALFLMLPLVLAPVISAQAHGGAEGCVTAISVGAQHVGHAQVSAEGAHEGHHAPESTRVAPIPCCLTVCPGVAEFTGQRSLPVIAVVAPSHFIDESAAGRAVEPADPPPRRHS